MNILNKHNYIMNQEKELKQRYANVCLLVAAIDKTISNPEHSVADYLSKGNAKSKALSASLIAGGEVAGVAASSATTIGTATAVTTFGVTAGGSLTTGSVVTALGGPIVWIIGGGALSGFIIDRLLKKRKEKKATQEKEALLKKIIAKQQAIINELKRKNNQNAQEIMNLKEALQMMRTAENQVRNDFTVA